MKQEFFHEPVLLMETIEFLLHNKNSSINKVYVDGTLGGGGYSREILKLTADDINIIAIDRDFFSIEYCKNSLVKHSERIFFYQDNFSNISEILKSSLKNLKREKISGFVLDLGLSTYQLDHEDGFSYQFDTFLDMRADKSQKLTAHDIVNNYSEKDLVNVLSKYGELKYSRKLTKDIIGFRKDKEIKSTFDLINAVKEKIPLRFLNRDLSKMFQALRIEVNDELNNLNACLNDIVEFLEPGARIVILSYHSLEDRIVKNFFRSSDELKVITKKPVTASEEEIGINIRSRSAKLRAAEKL